MKYVYNVLNKNSAAAFVEACEKIENYSPAMTKEDLIVDVDGTTIQSYRLNGKEVVFFDDYDIGAVFIESDVKLSDIGYVENIE